MLRWILLIACATWADPFCDGWEAGYAAGYCYQKYSCLAPLAPLCPLQSLRDENGYPGGYNRGFVAGQTKRAERDAASTSYSPRSYSAPSSGYRPRNYSNEMNQSMQNFGDAMAEVFRNNRQRKLQEEEARQQRRLDSVERLRDSLEIELKRRQIQDLDEKEEAKRKAGYGGMTDAQADSALRAKYPGLNDAYPK